MGRAPCCDKANVKKGPWSPEEDSKLKNYIEQHGTGGNWIALPQKMGLKRCGKSCRLRWLNYLRPNLKHGGFSEEEDNIICGLYISIGSRWSIIAAQLPGRTDNDIKNYWNTRLKKKLLGKQRKEKQPGKNKGARTSTSTTSDSSMHIPSCNNFFQNPYWPELPPVLSHYNSNQQDQPPPPPPPPPPRLNDHASIRKLLIKLGGKFSTEDDRQFVTSVANINSIHDHESHQLPSGISTVTSYTSPSLQFHDQPNPGVDSSSSGSVEGLETVTNNTNINGEGSYYAVVDHSSVLEELQVFDGDNNIINIPQKLDGLEFLLGEDLMVVDAASGNVTDEINYSGMLCSLVYPPLGSSSSSGEGLIHYQGCGFERELMSYPESI